MVARNSDWQFWGSSSALSLQETVLVLNIAQKGPRKPRRRMEGEEASFLVVCCGLFIGKKLLKIHLLLEGTGKWTLDILGPLLPAWCEARVSWTSAARRREPLSATQEIGCPGIMTDLAGPRMRNPGGVSITRALFYDASKGSVGGLELSGWDDFTSWMTHFKPGILRAFITSCWVDKGTHHFIAPKSWLQPATALVSLEINVARDQT